LRWQNLRLTLSSIFNLLLFLHASALKFDSKDTLLVAFRINVAGLAVIATSIHANSRVETQLCNFVVTQQQVVTCMETSRNRK